ncbi:hypothetical protein [Roseimaritima sediminicola]|uniref:hypothetical protein n=1 Tax=Roseimaritima sediminicola TaxID=2662066 RepID=UPI0012984D73|nr:hypothetical protein [Roseimaritima sediminicola]
MSVSDNDPMSRAYRAYKRKFQRWLLIAVVLLVVVSIKGVPHMQTTYSYNGARSHGWMPADRKLDAWYISVTGWKHVHSGQYGNDGCPFVLFIPLSECIDLTALAKRLSPLSLTRI